MGEIQVATLVEAVMLLVSNLVGGVLALLAWHVSEVDVREARRWQPPHPDPLERTRIHHNRRVVTEDARYGEIRRFQCHVLVALIGVFWILTPQPVNPAVVWWAVAVRAAAVILSFLLIDKTAAHLIARWRFDHPERPSNPLRALWPALGLAWRDLRARYAEREAR